MLALVYDLSLVFLSYLVWSFLLGSCCLSVSILHFYPFTFLIYCCLYCLPLLFRSLYHFSSFSNFLPPLYPCITAISPFLIFYPSCPDPLFCDCLFSRHLQFIYMINSLLSFLLVSLRLEFDPTSLFRLFAYLVGIFQEQAFFISFFSFLIVWIIHYFSPAASVQVVIIFGSQSSWLELQISIL